MIVKLHCTELSTFPTPLILTFNDFQRYRQLHSQHGSLHQHIHERIKRCSSCQVSGVAKFVICYITKTCSLSSRVLTANKTKQWTIFSNTISLVRARKFQDKDPVSYIFALLTFSLSLCQPAPLLAWVNFQRIDIKSFLIWKGHCIFKWEIFPKLNLPPNKIGGSRYSSKQKQERVCAVFM